MSNFFGEQQQVQAVQQEQQQGDFVTRDDLFAYVRSDSFRSVMKNQNADLYNFGQWIDYTPKIKAYGPSPVDPTIGSGGIIRGRYTRIGDTVICDFFVKFGSGMTAGNGAYYVTGPVPANSKSVSSVALPSVDYAYPQMYQGHFYAQEWESGALLGNFFWGHIAVGSDPNTGNAYDPTRFLMVIGDTPSDVAWGQPWAGHQFDTWFGVWPVGYNGTWHNATGSPVANTVFTGRVTYEAKPDVN